MHVLVLDAIHGGMDLGAAYAESGNSVDAVDVYRGTTPDLFAAARHRHYDLVTAPVHLDPDHPLLAGRTEPVITHHEAVRTLLGTLLPGPMIEITGAQGKTTTASAIASLLPGAGILHTSAGTREYPKGTLLYRKSITPASLLAAARSAKKISGWLVAETSLGVSGAADLSIISSAGDYRIAAGKKSALAEKVKSAGAAKVVLVAGGVPATGGGSIPVTEITRCSGEHCRVTWKGVEREFSSPLLLLPPYRTPLMLAAAAAAILGLDPAPLARFEALPGRMSLKKEGDLLIVDNANSGVNAGTTICAARYARHLASSGSLALVIGQAEKDGCVCEGFPAAEIRSAVSSVRPDYIVLVGRSSAIDIRADVVCDTLEEALLAARNLMKTGSIVLSVKTWR